MHATLIPIAEAEARLAAEIIAAIDAFLVVMAFRVETARPGFREIIDTLRWEEM